MGCASLVGAGNSFIVFAHYSASRVILLASLLKRRISCSTSVISLVMCSEEERVIQTNSRNEKQRKSNFGGPHDNNANLKELFEGSNQINL